MNIGFDMRRISDHELLRRTGELAARGRRIEAALIAHMAEVDRRRLYLGEACSSMFAYATERLVLSESQAYDRITVARTSRAYPVLLEMLADGRLTLTAASKLGPHLTAENAAGLLERATRATRRQVEMLVAEVAPRPDVAASVRKLPAPRSAEPACEVRPAGVAGVRPAGPAIASSPTASVAPIAPARYRVQFTASAELGEKITRARALLRHKIPSGDVGAIVEEAVTVLVATLERRKCGAAERPRARTLTTSDGRYVPAAVKRAVWARDESRCTFVDGQGRRCRAHEWLEIHHVDPFGRGGETTLENLRLLCRSHNQHQAELDYGAEAMRAVRRAP